MTTMNPQRLGVAALSLAAACLLAGCGGGGDGQSPQNDNKSFTAFVQSQFSSSNTAEDTTPSDTDTLIAGEDDVETALPVPTE